jgi:hypothetical protein
MKRTTLLLSFAAFMLFGTLSCGSGEQFLDISFTGRQAFLIPSGTRSCYGIEQGNDFLDVTEKHFSVRNMEFIWAHPDNVLTVAAIQLKFENPNLSGAEYSCTIAGDELLALVDSSTWNGEIDPSGSSSAQTIQETFCNIKCGGVTTEETNFTANGTIEIIGYMTNAEDEDFPIRFRTGFSLVNQE